MKTTKLKTQKGSDTDKAIAKPGLKSGKEKEKKSSSKISLGNAMAEKDEVKLAEERMRQNTKKDE